MATKIVMPEMGEGVIEGTISRWLKQEGEAVKQYEPVLEIETDKVTTEATAETDGILLKILVQEGETVPVGTVLAYIGASDEEISSDSESKAEAVIEPTATAKTATNGKRETARAIPYTGRISPVVGRIAGEHDVDLSLVEGTGLNGRITKNDILAYIERRDKESTKAAPAAKVETSPTIPPAAKSESEPVVTWQHPAPTTGPTAAPATDTGETLSLSSMRRAIAEHMVRSKHTSPHVTTMFEFDFSAVEAHRAAHKASFARDGINLTYTAYIIAATAEGLKQHPIINSSWGEDGIVLKREINIGVATAIEDGLIVPVIKNADSLNLRGLARLINDLVERARQRQLKPTDVQGGTFSITNHGVSGSLFATPIINQPQCGILSVGKIEKRVKVINDAIAVRPLAYVGLTFDHRIVDGASADNFVSTVKAVIENWH